MVVQAKPKLTAKQEAFCAFYLATRHATNSAIQAGYPLNSAQQIATENLSKPLIQKRLAEMRIAVIPSGALAKAAVALVSERMELLSGIARHPIETPVSAGHKVAAMAEMNKMEHIYEVGGNLRDVNVVFIIGKGYQEKAKDAT